MEDARENVLRVERRLVKSHPCTEARIHFPYTLKSMGEHRALLLEHSQHELFVVILKVHLEEPCQVNDLSGLFTVTIAPRRPVT